MCPISLRSTFEVSVHAHFEA